MALPSPTFVLFLSFCSFEKMTESTLILGSVSGSWGLDHTPARMGEGQEFGQSQSSTTGRDVVFAMDFNGSILTLKITFGFKSFAG